MKVDLPIYKQKIVDKAKELIMEYGVKGLNMNILAKECGLAKATLYKMIGSKEAIVEKIAIDFLAETRISVINQIFDPENFGQNKCEYPHKLVNLGIGKIRVLQKQIIKEYPVIESKLKEIWNYHKNTILKKFLILQKKNAIRNDIDISIIIDFAKRTFDHYTLSNAPDEDVRNELEQIFKVMLEGLMPPTCTKK